MRFYFGSRNDKFPRLTVFNDNFMKKIALFVFLLVSTLYSQTAAPKIVNLIRGGDMEAVSVDSNPWDGVYSGSLRVFTGQNSMVSTNGDVISQAFPPSVKASDLNGDGLKDLLVADSKGYFWIFLNKGTKKEPKFTRGELLPFWLKDSDEKVNSRSGAIVPKIQLVDFTGDGLVDLIIGDFEGRLYFVRNTGNASLPKFHSPIDSKELEIKTDSKGRLWCNYLAPCYYDWDGDGKMDLIMGEGTFSANNIFFLKNTGSNERPVFDPPKLMIASQGREHLVPQVIDWNEDGKPDLVFGERDKGLISVALYKETFPLNSPTEIKIGTATASSLLANPCFEDMNDDGLPDLLIGTNNGSIRMAINKGKKGAPSFDKLDPIKGESSYPSVLKSVNWINTDPSGIRSPDGTRFDLLKALSKKDRYKTEKNLVGYDPQLELPSGSTGQSCLFFEFVEPTQQFIKDTPKFVHEPQRKTFVISYPDAIPLKSDVEYDLSFFVKGSGFSDCRVRMLDDGNREKENEEPLVALTQENFNVSSSWQQETKKVKYTKVKGDKKELDSFRLTFTFVGEGNFYLDDIVLVEKKK